LAKYKKQGHDVVLCHVANGNKGHLIIPTDVLRVIRKHEAISSGMVIGVEVISLDMPDLEIYVITHYLDDYMPDHVTVSKLVFDASFAATVHYYKTSQKAHALNTPIFTWIHWQVLDSTLKSMWTLQLQWS
jgi:LmbE family N-acetylglucosaminyl deacetylase